MITKLKQLLAQWQAERERRRDLNEKLENLTDPMFLHRVQRDLNIQEMQNVRFKVD